MGNGSTTNLTKANLPIFFNELFIQYLQSSALSSSRLINEVPLYQAAYVIIDQLKKKHLHKLNKGHNAYRETLSLINTFKENLTVKQHITPLIQAHAPHLIMGNLNPDFNNEHFKEKIHRYRLNKTDSVQTGLFHFLSAMVMMYRIGLNQQPLKLFLEKLDEDDYLHKRVKARLRDEADKEAGEHWSTGKHEWLPCRLIKDILARSAGMQEDHEAFVLHEKDDVVEIIDWLSLHREFRSDVKRLYFANPEETLVSGHVPAIRDRLKGHPNEGSQVTGTKDYHAALENAFKQYKTVNDFIRQCRHIEKAHLIRGKKPIKPSIQTFFTVEGRRTSRQSSLSKLRHKKIRPGHHDRKALMLHLEKKTKKKDVLSRVPSLISTITVLSEPRSQYPTSPKPTKPKVAKTISITDSVSSNASTWSYDIAETHSDDVDEASPLKEPNLPPDYLITVKDVLFETLKQFKTPRPVLQEISSLFKQLRKQEASSREELIEQLEQRLTKKVKQQFMLNLDKLYTGQVLEPNKDNTLLQLASKMPYHDMIRTWFVVNEKKPNDIKYALSTYILYHTPLSAEINELLLRTRIQTDLLLPFFLNHKKLGDGREGDLHKRKQSQLNTARDIKRLIEESHNISQLYDNTQHLDATAEYCDLKSAYESLYTAISSPSQRYTHKPNIFSRCCPGMFSHPGPRSHLSQLAQRHLILVKTAFIENITALLRTTPEQDRKTLLGVIMEDINADDHFINQRTTRQDPSCCRPRQTRERQDLVSALNR